MNSSSVFWFERGHSVAATTRWLEKYSTTVSAGLSTWYLVAIFLGQNFMSNFPRKEMKKVLIAWNLSCAIFATFGCLRMVPELVYVLYYHGFRYSLCVPDFAVNQPTAFWTEMFMWSKAIELIDTVFLVLRKRPIIFLHWYHHVTVMMYTWHACREHAASGRWFISMNYTVHALMYTYYALRIIGFSRLPKFIPMSLTALQLSQMVIGCYISASVYWLKTSGKSCHQSFENLYFCFMIYFTYGVLFAKYFWETYMSKPVRVPEHEIPKKMQ